jgi:hypothetical protein
MWLSTQMPTQAMYRCLAQQGSKLYQPGQLRHSHHVGMAAALTSKPKYLNQNDLAPTLSLPARHYRPHGSRASMCRCMSPWLTAQRYLRLWAFQVGSACTIMQPLCTKPSRCHGA